MTENQLTGMKNLWQAATAGRDERYQLLDGKGRCVMFDITEERAREYARYYEGARVVRM